MFIVQDWAGNHLFRDITFKSADDGFDFLLEKFPSDEDLQEYFIVPKNK